MGTAAAAGALLAAAHVPSDFRTAYDAARNGSSLSRSERELRPVESVGFDRPEVFPAAARLMPTDATYVIAIGSPAAPTANRPVNWAPPFAQYWLLPRRHVDDLNEAQWVLAFGTHAAAAGIRLRRVYPLAPGVELGEVAG